MSHWQTRMALDYSQVENANDIDLGHSRGLPWELRVQTLRQRARLHHHSGVKATSLSTSSCLLFFKKANCLHFRPYKILCNFTIALRKLYSGSEQYRC